MCRFLYNKVEKYRLLRVFLKNERKSGRDYEKYRESGRVHRVHHNISMPDTAYFRDRMPRLRSYKRRFARGEI